MSTVSRISVEYNFADCEIEVKNQRTEIEEIRQSSLLL